jgi:hypothetical protein
MKSTLTSAMPAKKRKTRSPLQTTGPGEPVLVRLHQPLLGAIDDWCESQLSRPTRPEAIRRLVERGLAVETSARKPKRTRK